MLSKRLGILGVSSTILASCGSDVSTEPWDLRERISECVVDISDIEGEREPEIEERTNFNRFFIWIEPKNLFEDIEHCGCSVRNVTGIAQPMDASIRAMDLFYSESGTLEDGSFFADQYLFEDVEFSYSIDSVEEGVSVDRIELLFSIDGLPESGEIVINNQFTINLSEEGNGCGFLNSNGEVVDNFSIKRDYIFESILR
jgi:hypothetical protein